MINIEGETLFLNSMYTWHGKLKRDHLMQVQQQQVVRVSSKTAFAISTKVYQHFQTQYSLFLKVFCKKGWI